MTNATVKKFAYAHKASQEPRARSSTEKLRPDGYPHEIHLGCHLGQRIVFKLARDVPYLKGDRCMQIICATNIAYNDVGNSGDRSCADVQRFDRLCCLCLSPQ